MTGDRHPVHQDAEVAARGRFGIESSPLRAHRVRGTSTGLRTGRVALPRPLPVPSATN